MNALGVVFSGPDANSLLAELVRGSVAPPQILGSTPRGSEFRAGVKKIPSLVPCAKALVKKRPRSA